MCKIERGGWEQKKKAKKIERERVRKVSLKWNIRKKQICSLNEVFTIEWNSVIK